MSCPWQIIYPRCLSIMFEESRLSLLSTALSLSFSLSAGRGYRFTIWRRVPPPKPRRQQIDKFNPPSVTRHSSCRRRKKGRKGEGTGKMRHIAEVIPPSVPHESWLLGDHHYIVGMGILSCLVPWCLCLSSARRTLAALSAISGVPTVATTDKTVSLALTN